MAQLHEARFAEVKELETYYQLRLEDLNRQQDTLLGDLVPHTRDSLSWSQEVPVDNLLITLSREKTVNGDPHGYRILGVKRSPNEPFSDALQDDIDNLCSEIQRVNKLEKEFRGLEQKIIELTSNKVVSAM